MFTKNRSAILNRQVSSTYILQATRSSTPLILPPHIKLNIESDLLDKLIGLDTWLRLRGPNCNRHCQPECKRHNINLALLSICNKKASLNTLEREFKILCLLGGEEQDCSWLITKIHDDQLILIKDKINAYKNLLTEEDRQIIEQYKLAIIAALQNHLRLEHGLKYANNHDAKIKSKKSKIWLETPRYYYTTITAIGLSVLGNFIGVIQLLSYIPNISLILVYSIGGLLALGEFCLNYAMMVPALAEAFPNSSQSSSCSITDIHMQQLQVVKNTNQQLTANLNETDRINSPDFNCYKKLSQFFNNYIANMSAKPKAPGITRIGGTWAFALINVVMTTCSGYFWANAALAIFNATLMTSPLGWALCLFFIVSLLHNNHTLRTASINLILHPDTAKLQRLEEDLYQFKKAKNEINFKLDYVYSRRIPDSKSGESEHKSLENTIDLADRDKPTLSTYYRRSLTRPR